MDETLLTPFLEHQEENFLASPVDLFEIEFQFLLEGKFTTCNDCCPFAFVCTAGGGQNSRFLVAS